MEEVKQESIFISINETESLHLKRIFKNLNGEPVFMLHGSIENGKIFYSESNKGFAPFLAQNGFDVFIADMRGRGKSTPPVSRGSKYGQVDIIKTDISAFIEKIKELKGDLPIHWVSHSWGGVLMLSHLGRFNPNVKSIIHFAVKRRITVRNIDYWKLIFLQWGLIGKLLIWMKGYLPAKDFKFGSDNEPKNHLKQINHWIPPRSKWIDNIDDFNYGNALRNKKLPPQLFIAGLADTVLGNPIDVKLLANEIGEHQNTDLMLLSKENGNFHDYGHNNMLSHKDAPKDHFLEILEWMNKV